MDAPRIPTDRELLKEIYESYYLSFVSKNSGETQTNYVPIDLPATAAKFGISVHVVFGFLYYHLNSRYGYERPDGAKVLVYTPVANHEKDCVHFPMIASILASLENEHRQQFLYPTVIAVAALLVSIAAIFIAQN